MAASTAACTPLSLAARAIACGNARVVVLTGAGVSVSAGIPDFRSPGGMYDTLRPELLTATPQQRQSMRHDPTAVVSWSLFRHNPLPYLELRRPFILGTAERRWKPTASHWFVRLLHDKGKLRRLLTQNIDGLDYHLSLPVEKVVGVHGSLGQVQCEGCGAFVDPALFRDQVRDNIKDIYSKGDDGDGPAQSTLILCSACGKALVKPATVLYGRSLPASFSEAIEADFSDASVTTVLLVVGTSLTVHPAAGVPALVGPDTTRIVVDLNDVDLPPRRQPVSATSSKDGGGGDDLFLEGEADAVLRSLAAELGWAEEMELLQRIL